VVDIRCDTLARMKKALIALALVSCGSHTPAPVTTRAETKPPPAVSSAWIEDDYAHALETAKKANAPLFVDASAVWCHTCKAMRAFVLDDPTLPKGFVRFSFDVEKEQNAAASQAFPAHVLPTFFVVDPADGSIHGRWEGAGSVQQMRAFMTDAAREIALAHSNQLKPDDPLALLLAGHRAALRKNAKEAEADFAGALAKAPPNWEHAPEALLGLLKAEEHLGSGCAETAEKALEGTQLGRTSVMADFASEALDCVEKDDDARAKHVRELVAKDVADLARDEKAPLSPDDRSDAWKIVWDAREALGDQAGAREAAKARLDVIMKAVAAHPEPEMSTTFDGARMETLEYLGRGQEAAQFLEAQEKALPDDYNPPHRLAHVYYKLGRYDDALAAINRALPKAYGARKGLMLRLKSDILLAQGKKAEARAALEEQLAVYRSLPEGQKKPALEKAVQAQIDKLK
jgi:tetratricopeptide (TPR) repeat protein